VRHIVEIAASWTNFHLAKDEYAASAVAHKAREVLDLSKSFARMSNSDSLFLAA
jgi:hypothetical protein